MVVPLHEASEEVKRLSIKKKLHDQKMEKLKDTQSEIMKHDFELKDIEWQYEVRLQ